MSAIENLRPPMLDDLSQAGNFQLSTTNPLDTLVQAVAKQLIQIVQFKNEYEFLKNLEVCLLSPWDFPSLETYVQLLKKFGILVVLLKDINFNTSIKKTIEHLYSIEITFNDLETQLGLQQLDFSSFSIDNDLTNIRPQARNHESKEMIKLSQLLSSIQEGFQGFDNFLDALSQRIHSEGMNVADWKIIQEVFKKKNLPFSEEFMNRCQRVAQKALAA